MQEIIKWLREVEYSALEVYKQGSTAFSADPSLSRFLETMAEEEAWHCQIIGDAANYIDSDDSFQPVISIDRETADKINSYFADLKDGFAKNTITRDGVLEKIVAAELSEWNDIFFYVVNTLKRQIPEFKYPAARLQAHIRGIEQYLETVEKRSDILGKISELPSVWTENILIVEDEPMVAELIKSLLNREGNIDIAYDGKAALDLILEKYYKLVISDIDMPVMNGIMLYEEAIMRFPNLNSRFLFITGDLSPERIRFFDDRKVKYLSKPMKIKTLRQIAHSIILSL